MRYTDRSARNGLHLRQCQRAIGMIYGHGSAWLGMNAELFGSGGIGLNILILQFIYACINRLEVDMVDIFDADSILHRAINVE